MTGSADRQRMMSDYFDDLAAMWNERTFRHIQALGLARGWRCWEVGAGGASVPGWLAEQVGPTGHVLATDVDTTVLEDAADPSFEVRRHDLNTDPPPADQFDLVHARLVLEHLADPPAALTTLVAPLRPGGWLLVESSDPELQPLACPDVVGPSEALANKLRDAFWDRFGRRSHLSLGRTLPRLLRGTGLTDVSAEGAFTLGGSAARRMQRVLIARVRHELIAGGSATADEIDGHLADLGSADLDLAVFPVISASGRLAAKGRPQSPSERNTA